MPLTDRQKAHRSVIENVVDEDYLSNLHSNINERMSKLNELLVKFNELYSSHDLSKDVVRSTVVISCLGRDIEMAAKDLQAFARDFETTISCAVVAKECNRSQEDQKLRMNMFHALFKKRA